MQRTTCGGCGSGRLEVFLDLGKTPLADRFPASPDEVEDTWPLQVAVCTACWLAQLTEVVPDVILWADYGFYSGASPSKVAYHADYARWAIEEFGWQAGRLVVEIGCNDGDLLRHFAQAGLPVLGVDPAEGPAEVATDRGIRMVVDRFGRGVADAIREGCGPAGLVLANHVAAHVADLDDFLGGIGALLGRDGVAVLEVQYLGDLLAGNQYDHVYHEHRFFFSVGSLSRLLSRHGLLVDRVIRIPAQGGSIRVVCRPTHPGERPPPRRPAEQALEDTLASYQAMQPRVDYLRDVLVDMLEAQQRAGRRLAGYGATAKSTTLLNWCGIGPDMLEYVEDLTPYKWGRFTPGTHIPIIAPPQDVRTPTTLGGRSATVITKDRPPPDTYLLLAWNYLPGILQRERAFLEHGGGMLVPIPVPVLL